jgi:hypothetical protein
MPPSAISFLVHCPFCSENVSATTILGREELGEAISREADVRVIHMAAVGDHQWSLNPGQKDGLRKRMAEGLV